MDITFGDIAGGVAAAGTLGAIIVWWVSRILDLRKEIIQLQMKDEFKSQQINDLCERIEKLEDLNSRRRNQQN